MCGEVQLTITNDKKEFTWDGYGLKLHIVEKSLPSGTEQITLNIAASIAGQYKFPENSHLVSAVYWFRCCPKCEFEKQVTLEIQHCAKSENASKMSFVRATSHQEQLLYTFKHLAGGQFVSCSTYGVLKLKRFCAIASIQAGSEEKEYYSRLFYSGQESIDHREIDFVVTLNTQVHHTVSLDMLLTNLADNVIVAACEGC